MLGIGSNRVRCPRVLPHNVAELQIIAYSKTFTSRPTSGTTPSRKTRALVYVISRKLAHVLTRPKAALGDRESM